MKTKQVAALLIIASLPMPAMAYIDPGSGSAIMSAIIGFIVAIWLMVKTYWYKLKSFFTPGRVDESLDEPPETPSEDSAK
jgi:hypothetical protein